MRTAALCEPRLDRTQRRAAAPYGDDVGLIVIVIISVGP
jgi:hypothetical protein